MSSNGDKTAGRGAGTPERPADADAGQGRVARQSGGGAVKPSAGSDISSFLQAAKQSRKEVGRGRLVFALDATMSRQPTWDRACNVQAEMFEAASATGGLAMQLVYFRGFGECGASKWVDNGRKLAGLMSRIDCRGGTTQIRKVLRHTLDEARRRKVQALVYIGDCVEEDVDGLCARAGEMGVLGVPAFVFQEGAEPHATRAFREIARLSGGAHFALDATAPGELAALLKAAAVYATSGRDGLERLRRSGDDGARLFLSHLR